MLGTSTADLAKLSALVSAKFAVAREAGDVHYFDSRVRTARPVDATAAQCVPWSVRTVPALLHKPSNKGKDAGAREFHDVFAPPYAPNLLVAELPEYTVLLNKFCVLPEHALLVTREFVPQDLPPTPAMLALVYKIICAHEARGEHGEAFAFFNCGAPSGASQPHCHFQLVEVGARDGVALPIETLLASIPRDGDEYRHTHMLPTPWQHFVALLEPQPDDRVEAYIGARFMQALDSMFQERMHLLARDSGAVPAGRPSFNVLVTRRALHIVPRRTDAFSVRDARWAPFDGSADVPENTGMLSVNAMGYAGFMLTRHDAEVDALLDADNARVPHVLAHTGLPPVSGAAPAEQ